jgi:hypothetical protein
MPPHLHVAPPLYIVSPDALGAKRVLWAEHLPSDDREPAGPKVRPLPVPLCAQLTS